MFLPGPSNVVGSQVADSVFVFLSVSGLGLRGVLEEESPFF